MMTLRNKEFQLIAIPRKVFRDDKVPHWEPVMEMSGRVGLDHAPHSLISITQRNGDFLRKLVHIDPMSDLSKVLVLQIKLDRKLIAEYLGRTRDRQEQILKANGHSKPGNLGGSFRRARGTVFNGELTRDFHSKAYSILVASHLAAPRAVSTQRIVSISGGEGGTSEGFKMHLDNRNDCASIVELRELAPKAVFDFLWAKPEEIAGQPKSQFMMGLSYVSQAFRHSENPLIVFMWSLAAIEAMLSTTSDKANSGTLELRLKALLADMNMDSVVGKFRDLYKYRNAIFHGNVALPHSFDPRNLFGFSGVKHSDTIPYDIASFTYALALKILQRFFELGRYDVKYDTTIKS